MHKTVLLKCLSDSDSLTKKKKKKKNLLDIKNKLVPTSPKSCKECVYCHKMGHTMAECHNLKWKQE